MKRYRALQRVAAPYAIENEVRGGPPRCVAAQKVMPDLFRVFAYLEEAKPKDAGPLLACKAMTKIGLVVTRGRRSRYPPGNE
jgi:hypothetical protein